MTNKGQSLPISIPKIFLYLLIGIGIAILFLLFLKYRPVESLNSDQAHQLREVVLSAIPKISERWVEGDLEKKFNAKMWSCPELAFDEAIHPSFLKCRQEYFECWAQGKAQVDSYVQVKLGKSNFKVKLKPHSNGLMTQYISRHTFSEAGFPDKGILINLEVENLGVWPVILEDTCRDTYLLERVYSYGPRPKRNESSKEMMWDNFGRSIFVDKFLVSQSDVAHWRGSVAKDPVQPALNLSDVEQEEYCESIGARKLEAKIWDAATMTPSDLSRPMPEFVVKPWLPWTRDRRGTFFEKAALDEDWKPSLHDCKRAFVKECTSVYRPHESDNVSWTGVYHVLGGESERFRNPIEPELVQRESSKRLFARSSGHKLGSRIKKASASGFRCYREVYP